MHALVEERDFTPTTLIGIGEDSKAEKLTTLHKDRCASQGEEAPK